MKNPLNFNDIKQEINKNFENCDKNLLLGNGFTMACATNDNLTSKSIIYKVHNYFKDIKTIEKIKNIEEYIYEVEKQVIKQIYESLPYNKIEQLENINKIIDFLAYFDSYYTLNYDHILYKLLLLLNDKQKDKSTDGFKFGFWKEDNSQNTYYLHGAFHFIKDENRIQKVVREKDNLYNSISNEWNIGKKSHVIISSDYKTKKLKMTSQEFSPYFKYCFDSFRALNGILVTMGVSFSNSDRHIVEEIKNNNTLKKVYLGYYTNDDYKHIKELFTSDSISYEIEYYCTKDIFNF